MSGQGPFTLCVLAQGTLAIESSRLVGTGTDSCRSRFGYSTPLRLQLGPQKFYLIPDAKLNSAVFKAGRALTSSTGVKLAMENLFGTPEHVMPLYRKDNSGSLGKPLPGSNIEPKNRIFHLQHRVAQKYLSGNSLNLMTERFVTVFSGRLAEKNIGDDWVEFPNLYKFLQNELFISTVTALYGEKIWTANPTLVDDFWDLDSHSATLFKGYPRWMAPAAYGAQKRTLDCIKRWHALARANSSINTISEDDPEWEPYWGAKFMKARQQYMGEVDLLDDTGKAAEDVGLMFAYVGPYSAIVII